MIQTLFVKLGDHFTTEPLQILLRFLKGLGVLIQGFVKHVNAAVFALVCQGEENRLIWSLILSWKQCCPVVLKGFAIPGLGE